MDTLNTMAVVSRRQMSSPERIWEQAGNTADGMDRDAFCELLNGLWKGMGRTEMPDADTIRVWYSCLDDLTVAQFGRGIQKYIKHHSDKFVNVKMIRDLSGAQQATDIAGITAWGEVLSEINRVGAYQSPTFTDPRTAATIKSLGGWVRVCDTGPDELHKWTRFNFLKTFAAMPARADARLTNLVEMENARTGQVEAAAEVQRRITDGHRLRITETAHERQGKT